MTILDEIIAHKREEVADAQARVSLAEMRRLAERAVAEVPIPDFTAAVTGPPVRIIAEVKRASPSAGTICAGADPAATAKRYERAGAAAVSVLTDRRYFAGSPDDLRAVRQAVSLPILRKDFIVDSYQVYESRALGAAAVLLIAGALPPDDLSSLGRLARELGLAVVFEVHCEAHIDEAVAAGARVIGINNRDLRTMTVDLETTLRLRPRIPPGIVVISESGIASPDDVAQVCRAGVDAILVGTALMASPDPESDLRALRHMALLSGCGDVRRQGRPPSTSP